YAISITLYVASSYLVGVVVAEYTSSALWGQLTVIGFVLMPRNTWLMLSGMETPLFLFLLIFSVHILDRLQMRYDVLLGIVIGLAFLTRPEGVLIMIVCVPVRIALLAKKRLASRRRILSSIATGAFALAIALPWIVHCLSITGNPLPDTFYAKVHLPTETEIAVWDFWWRYWLITCPFILVAAVLGLVLVKKGKPHTWLLALSLTILYRLSLPFTSLMNNARWLVPPFDLFLITSIPALVLALHGFLKTGKREDEIFNKILISAIVVALVLIPLTPDYFRQSSHFGNAVKNINDQQVQVGTWLRENTPEDAIIAVTDAGALRFISGRVVIDMAGLVSPEFTYENLSLFYSIQYLRNRSCEYFAFFDDFFYPTYYRYLRRTVQKLYSVTLTDNIISVRDTLSVFYINWSLWQFTN
ncbi:MAG: hypothetical protein ACW992_10405, partial [Candidatus Thorarchaeota archaeon]